MEKQRLSDTLLRSDLNGACDSWDQFRHVLQIISSSLIHVGMSIPFFVYIIYANIYIYIYNAHIHVNKYIIFYTYIYIYIHMYVYEGGVIVALIHF